MTKVLVDTNVLIDYTKGFNTDLINLFELSTSGQITLILNPIIIAEFMADRHLKNTKKCVKAQDFINQFQHVDLTKKIGELAGKLVRESNELEIADALIAATCLLNDCHLATRNQKDFQKIPGLKLWNFEY